MECPPALRSERLLLSAIFSRCVTERIWWISVSLTGLGSCPGPPGVGCGSSGSLGFPRWAWRCWGCRWWGCTSRCGHWLCWRWARETHWPEEYRETEKYILCLKRRCFASKHMHLQLRVTALSLLASDNQCPTPKRSLWPLWRNSLKADLKYHIKEFLSDRKCSCNCATAAVTSKLTWVLKERLSNYSQNMHTLTSLSTNTKTSLVTLLIHFFNESWLRTHIPSQLL